MRTKSITVDIDETDEALEARAEELWRLTQNWSVWSLTRRYPPDQAEAYEDFQDDAMLLAEHGYQARPGSDYREAVFDLLRPTAEDPPPRGATRTVRYAGTFDEAMAAFQTDAHKLARSYWYPTAQTYVPGMWGWRAWVAAFLTTVILVGLFALVYMVVVRPAGELVVTYEERQPVARVDPADQIRKLAALRDEGIIAEDEFAAKKRQLLGT